MSVFDKLSLLQEKLGNDFAGENFKRQVRILASWEEKSHKERKKIKLSKDEVRLYEFLVKNEYKPGTVYRWILLSEAPQEVREKLRSGEMSLKDASREKAKTKRLLSSTELDFMNIVVSCFQKYMVR